MELVILQWNCRSLVAHKAELRNYLATAHVKPSLICVQETWLKPGKDICLPGYSIERRDRAGAQQGGGVATFIIDGLSYTVLDKPDDIEALSLQIRLSSKRAITVSNVYLPSEKPFSEAALRKVFAVKDSIIVGDFNSLSSLWGSPITDAKGRQIEVLLDDYELSTINSGEGTYIKSNGAGYSHLDLSIVPHDLALKARWSVIQDTWGSDHLPALTTLNARPALETNELPRWNLKKANWELYREELDAQPAAISAGESTEQAYARLVDAVKDAADKSIPKKSLKTSHTPTPWWNDECDKAIKLRNTARNRWQRHGGEELRKEYYKLNGIAQWTLKDASQRHWRDYCSTLTAASQLGSVWNMARRMTGTAARQSMPNLVVIKGDQHEVFESNEAKANLLAQVYAEVSSDSKYEDSFKVHKAAMELEWSSESAPRPGNESAAAINDPIGWMELQQALESSKRNSSPGPDAISYEMMRNLPMCAQKYLLDLFNRIWSEGKLMKDWKEALVIPIPKPEATKSEPQSYRPIALTAVMCKLFERIVTNRLTWYMESLRLLNPMQSGFRKQRSTCDHIVRLQDNVNKALHNNEHTLAIFLDFSKAFDMVWRAGLLYKLRRLGIGGRIYNWIADFLTGRKIRVRVGAAISEPVRDVERHATRKHYQSVALQSYDQRSPHSSHWTQHPPVDISQMTARHGSVVRTSRCCASRCSSTSTRSSSGRASGDFSCRRRRARRSCSPERGSLPC